MKTSKGSEGSIKSTYQYIGEIPRNKNISEVMAKVNEGQRLKCRADGRVNECYPRVPKRTKTKLGRGGGCYTVLFIGSDAAKSEEFFQNVK